MSFLTQSGMLPQLTKYEIVEEVGHGGMATVYRARDRRLQRDVAVKIIHKHLRESPEIAARFEAEARAVAKLRHPNIVEVYDVSERDDPEKYLVVELMRGTTLRHILGEVPEMPPEVAAAIGIELGSALAHAHSAGVVHRDLKPENVLLEVEPAVRIKLTDFGIAKVLDAQGVTSTGQVLGSPAHMAPEQIEGGEVDARADVFGLGVLLYECMVGHLPFEGNNPAQVLRRVLEGSYAPADRERPTVGARWSAILARALAKEADLRYPSADAMVTALGAELEGLGIVDSAAELSAFFADRAGYSGGHAARLVPLLIQRGEQARRGGSLRDAAADYNRALAYRPQDPALLRLIGRLGRRRLARRAAGGIALGLGLGVVGMAIAAGLASRRRASDAASSETPPLPPSIAVLGPSPLSAREVAKVEGPEAIKSAAAARVLAPDRRAPAVSRHPSASATAAAAPEPPPQRDVKFEVMPKGALVSIDGSAAEELFLKVKKLAVGIHTFEAHVPDSKCCESVRREEEIKPDDGSGSAQQVSLSLRFRDALLSAPDAPPGALLSCPILGISGPASGRFPVHMSSFEQDISCNLDVRGASSQKSSVTLRAGELISVTWVAPQRDGGAGGT
jgi:tRNA A-37 threonylcarbamoyl transferase component Bud32